MTDPTNPAASLPMYCSSTIAALVVALSKAQGAFPEIGKDKRAHIQTKAGGHFSYQYADLATILGAVRKPLSENELAILQPVQVTGNRVSVTTVLAHSSGEWVSDELALPIADPTDARSLASAVTYARRYGLIALLGIAPTDEDDDADAVVTPSASKAMRPPAPAKPSPTPPPTPVAPSSGDGRPAPTAADYISDAQRRRLFAIARAGGWEKDDLHAWLITQGIGSTTKIKTDEYDAVVSLLQRAAP